jgi:hypothetical protein
MSTRAFNTGVSGTELTAAERAFGRRGCRWDFIPFRRSIEISTQVTVPLQELTVAGVTAANLGGLSIPVDGAAVPRPSRDDFCDNDCSGDSPRNRVPRFVNE